MSSNPRLTLRVSRRHPRVQPHMLKDLFGGEGKVENVKIVPDRNVSHLSIRRDLTKGN